MLAYQSIFKRYELKFMLDSEQKELILKTIEPYMALDKYGRTTIRNLYFDTDDFLLIRRSIEKPAYKEKLRVRSYEKATDDSDVFVELKKKFKHVVYKRRIVMPYSEAMNWLTDDLKIEKHTQICDEVDYFLEFYKNLHPTVFLSYEREAYYSKDKSDFRITFDDNILCRETQLSLTEDPFGTPILEEGKVLMEIKCSGAVPMWLTKVLSENRIFKTSFSKYGTAYRNLIFPKLNFKDVNTGGFYYD